MWTTKLASKLLLPLYKYENTHSLYVYLYEMTGMPALNVVEVIHKGGAKPALNIG